MSKPNILFYPHVKYRAQFFLRYVWPGKQLAAHGYNVRIKDPRAQAVWSDDQTIEDFLWADVVVAFYPKTATGITLLEVCQEMGIPLVVDVDDYAFDLDPSNPAYGFAGMQDVEGIWHDGVQYSKSVVMQDHARWLTIMQHCDALTVTQKKLGDMYAPFIGHDRIWVLPNSLDLSYYKPWKRRAPDDEIRIGWQGGSSHHEDLKLLVKPLKRIVADHPKAKVVFLGSISKELRKELPDIEHHPWVDTDTFYTKLGSLDLDIGLCPVADTNFNRGKSNLKMIEYGASGTPSVCSTIPDGPYNSPLGFDADGVDRILVENNEHDWYNAINNLIVNKELRDKIGAGAKETATEVHNIENTWEHWGDCYDTVLKGMVDLSL